MGINNCNCRNKDKCPLLKSCQIKYIIYRANTDCDIAGYNKNVTLAHVKQHSKIVSGIIKSRSTTLNIKMIQNYQKNFGKDNLLNKRTGIINTCRHRSKYKLANCETID